MLVLGSLLDSWETFRTLLTNYASDGVISVYSSKSSVLNEEIRRKIKGSYSSDVLITGPMGGTELMDLSIENKIGAILEAYLMILSDIIVL